MALLQPCLLSSSMIKLTIIINKDILYPCNKPFFLLLMLCKKICTTLDKIPMTGSVLAISSHHFKMKSDTRNRKSLHQPAIRRAVWMPQPTQQWNLQKYDHMKLKPARTLEARQGCSFKNQYPIILCGIWFSQTRHGLYRKQKQQKQTVESWKPSYTCCEWH